MFSPCLTSPRSPKLLSEHLPDPQELKLSLSLSLSKKMKIKVKTNKRKLSNQNKTKAHRNQTASTTPTNPWSCFCFLIFLCMKHASTNSGWYSLWPSIGKTNWFFFSQQVSVPNNFLFKDGIYVHFPFSGMGFCQVWTCTDFVLHLNKE